MIPAPLNLFPACHPAVNFHRPPQPMITLALVAAALTQRRPQEQCVRECGDGLALAGRRRRATRAHPGSQISKTALPFLGALDAATATLAPARTTSSFQLRSLRLFTGWMGTILSINNSSPLRNATEFVSKGMPMVCVCCFGFCR